MIPREFSIVVAPTVEPGLFSYYKKKVLIERKIKSTPTESCITPNLVPRTSSSHRESTYRNFLVSYCEKNGDEIHHGKS